MHSVSPMIRVETTKCPEFVPDRERRQTRNEKPSNGRANAPKRVH